MVLIRVGMAPRDAAAELRRPQVATTLGGGVPTQAQQQDAPMGLPAHGQWVTPRSLRLVGVATAMQVLSHNDSTVTRDVVVGTFSRSAAM